jgi:hypothetical protein
MEIHGLPPTTTGIEHQPFTHDQPISSSLCRYGRIPAP